MDEFDEHEPPPRRSWGCLKGCLGAVLLVVLFAGAAIGFTAWRIYESFRDDPELTAIVDVARADARVNTALGGRFTVMEIEHRSFPLKSGKQAQAYRLVLIGANGQSTLDVRLEPAGGGPRIATMTLTGPDGHTVWLKGGAPNPWMRPN